MGKVSSLRTCSVHVCVGLCDLVQVTHIPQKQTAEIPPGSWEVGVSHVLINASVIPLSSYRKQQKKLKSTDKGHPPETEREGRGGQGPRGTRRQIQRIESSQIKRCLPSIMLLWTAAANSTVNKLTLHNVEGADGKAMVRLSL